MKTSAAARNQMMLSEPVGRVIPRLAVPSIISMLITSIYNMADTFFVSQIGTSASGAVGVIFSAMSIIQAISFTIGMGTGTNVSQCLGAGDDERANHFASTGFFTALITGTVLAAVCLLNIDWLVRFLGATETIAPYAKAYATYIFYGAPFMMGSLVLNNLLRFQGLSAYGMIGITVGGVLNMLLDPLFIFTFGLGTAGAAIATALSQFVSFSILLAMTIVRPESLTVRLKDFKPSLPLYGRVLYLGFPSLGRQGIASVSTILLNTAAGVYGDAAIAAMSIVSRFIMFINSTVIGFGQGFQPVCGFSFGAGKYARVREAYWFCVKVAAVILLTLSAIAFVFAEPIITVFRRDDLEVIRIGTLALRAQLVTLPLWSIITMSNMFTQSIGYGVRATLIATARQGIFLIPLLLVLPNTSLGLLGIQIAQPIADACTFVLALAVVTGISSSTMENVRKIVRARAGRGHRHPAKDESHAGPRVSRAANPGISHRRAMRALRFPTFHRPVSATGGGFSSLLRFENPPSNDKPGAQQHAPGLIYAFLPSRAKYAKLIGHSPPPTAHMRK